MFNVLASHLKDKNVHSINALPSNNIELFDCYTGMVFGKLYRSFPLPVSISAEDFIDYKGEQGAKEAGQMRAEGKDYIVKDGDVMNFLFNV